MTFWLARSRRASSIGDLDGWTRNSSGAPVLLARRRFNAAGDVDTGQIPIRLKRATGTPERSLWERIDDPAPEIIEQVTPVTGFHQHYITIPRGFTELWATIDFRITARGADDRTRVIGLADARTRLIKLGVYARETEFDVWDHDFPSSNAVGGGTFAVGNTWQRVVVHLRGEEGGSSGNIRVWLNSNTDEQAPDIQLTHDHLITSQTLQFGSGSVDAATTFEIAELAVYDRNPLALTPYSSGWASSPLFQEIVPALSAITLTPDPMSAQDGATSGTVIGQLATVGGRGDGTWSLTGGLASIATINGTDVELTATVSTAGDDGTTGTISYSGDSAGGSASDITTSLAVTSATTNLTLTAASGGTQQQGTLDTSQPFQSIRMVPRTEPVLAASWPKGDAPDEFSPFAGFGGLRLDPANTVILRVNSLDGGTGVGTLRWAAETSTGNSGEDLTGKTAVVVFDVSGHIELDNRLQFRNGPKWFAGQTAPVDSNGRAGIVVHGVNRNNDERIWQRTFYVSEFVVEHLTFVDGRIPRNSDGSISPSREPPFGALDVGLDSNKDISRILIRNCLFLWGLDETVQVLSGGKFTSGHRTDNVEFADCINASPMRNDVDGKRGYACMITSGAHRVMHSRSMMAGTVVRHYWQQEVTSTAAVNLMWYDTDRGIFLNPQSYTRVDVPEMRPRGRFIDAVGCWWEEGPSYTDKTNDLDFIMQRWQGTKPDAVITFYKAVDNYVKGQPETINYAGLTGWTDNGEPLFEYARPPIPAQDVPAYILAHGGPCPAYPNDQLEKVKTTWQNGGSLEQRMRADGELRWPEEWPGTLIQSTTSAANVPASPFAIESNGLTALENWLEAEHIAKGGAPYQDFGRWVRFPWGGRVRIATNGTVDFDPVDMPAGESGTIEITRADGSTVSVTCSAT